MWYYDGINLSEGIDLTKNNNSNKCIICHYGYFNHGLKFQIYFYNCYHDLTMLCLNLGNIAIVVFKGVDYHFIIHDTSNS